MKVEEYVQETPIKMQEILNKSPEVFEEVAKASFDKIILTGSGTSYHSALQTKAYLQKLLNVEVEVMYPFMVTEELLKANQHETLFIGISQGGSSYSTYNAMKLAKEHGCKIASMPGIEEGALIDELADFILPVYVGPEDAGPKTKGYNTTKFHIMLFALYVAIERDLLSKEDFEAEKEKMTRAIEKFDALYQESEKWVKEHQEEFSKAKDIRIVGSADLYGDILESALKILETLRIPVTGYEFEEFIHGIYNAINENSTIILIDSGQEPRMERLVSILKEWTEHVYVISNQPSNQAHFSLDIDGDNEFETLQFMTPIQLICAYVPPLKGVNPNIPKDPEFHQKMESKRL